MVLPMEVQILEGGLGAGFTGATMGSGEAIGDEVGIEVVMGANEPTPQMERSLATLVSTGTELPESNLISPPPPVCCHKTQSKKGSGISGVTS